MRLAGDYRGDQRLGVGRSDPGIDVHPVRRHADHGHVRAQPAQRIRRHAPARTVRAIEHNIQFRKIEPLLHGLEAAVDITACGALHLARHGNACRCRIGALEGVEHGRLKHFFHLIGELHALMAEQFEAIVLELIVRSGHHHAEGRARFTRHHGDGRRRHHAKADRRQAHAAKACNDGGLDHLAGPARVAADDDFAPAIGGKAARCRDGQAQRCLHRHGLLVDPAADPVRAEKLACHRMPPRNLGGRKNWANSYQTVAFLCQAGVTSP